MAKKLNQYSGMPQMSAAFVGWKSVISLRVITQTVVDGFITDSVSSITIKGTWQPLSAEQISLKPDGQRSWEWFQLHVEGNNNTFKTNDKIIKDDITYKVMAKKDYSLNNYVEYHLVEDYQNG